MIAFANTQSRLHKIIIRKTTSDVEKIMSDVVFSMSYVVFAVSAYIFLATNMGLHSNLSHASPPHFGEVFLPPSSKKATPRFAS
mgnify:CR=1 FL=1